MNNKLMPTRFFLSATRLLVSVAVASVFLASCMSSPDRYRGSLSDGMDKARDDNEGSRSVPDYPMDDDDDDGDWFWGIHVTDDPDDSEDGYESDDDEQYVPPETPVVFDGYAADRISFGFRGASNLASSEDWSAPFDGDFLVGVSTEEAALIGYLGLRVMEPGESTPFAASIEDSAGLLRIGAQFRWYPLGFQTYMSPLVDFSIGGFTMGWTYRNALTAGNDTITGDSLGGLHVSVGAGVSLARWERAEFSVRIVPEAYLFSDMTDEGFVNDFFSPLGVVKLEAEVLFR